MKAKRSYVSMRYRLLFFDDPAIIRAFTAAERKALMRAGGRIRKTAQHSMRYGKKPSAPGRPPTAHKDTRRGPLLRKMYEYAWDTVTRRAVIGPVKLDSSSVRSAKPLPALHEFGGRATVSKRKKRRDQAPRVGRYPARPYSEPALMKNLDWIPKAWSGAVKPA